VRSRTVGQCDTCTYSWKLFKQRSPIKKMKFSRKVGRNLGGGGGRSGGGGRTRRGGRVGSLVAMKTEARRWAVTASALL